MLPFIVRLGSFASIVLLLCFGGLFLFASYQESIDNSTRVATNCTIIDRIITEELNGYYAGYIELLYTIKDDNYTSYIRVTNNEEFHNTVESYFTHNYPLGEIINCYYNRNNYNIKLHLYNPVNTFKTASVCFSVAFSMFVI